VSKFAEYFSEPVHYDGWGLVVDGVNNNTSQAIEIFIKELGDNIVEESQRFVRHYVTTNIKWSYVRWHGGIDDDGQMYNGWWIGESPSSKGAKAVFYINPDRHYMRLGHHYTPAIDQNGRVRRWGGYDCNVCTQLEVYEKKLESIKEKSNVTI
jgi:hypothetical protein